MEDNLRNIVALGVISWSTLFVLIRKTCPKRSFEFCNRIVSTIHAIMAVTFASLSVEHWNCPVCPLASNSSPKQVKYNNIVIFIYTYRYSLIINYFFGYVFMIFFFTSWLENVIDLFVNLYCCGFCLNYR